MARPIHQLSVKPLMLMPVSGSTGKRPVGSIFSLPPILVRTFLAVSASQPYSCEQSHQWLFKLAYAGGRLDPCGAGSGSVRGTRNDGSLHVSFGASGISANSVFDRLCTNQSCTWNWIHDAASRLRMVAGVNSSRVISSRLTTRGLGVIRFAVSGTTLSSGTLRPKRRPTEPIFG